MYVPYAWKIYTDHLAKDGSSGEGGTYSLSGHIRLPPTSPMHHTLLARLDAGEGREFQMLDDDETLYYTGRILVLAASDGSGGDATINDLHNGGFEPLDEFGEPDSGCTSIMYRDAAGEWEFL